MPPTLLFLPENIAGARLKMRLAPLMMLILALRRLFGFLLMLGHALLRLAMMTDGEMSRPRTVLATVLLRLSVISKSLVNMRLVPRRRKIGKPTITYNPMVSLTLMAWRRPIDVIASKHGALTLAEVLMDNA